MTRLNFLPYVQIIILLLGMGYGIHPVGAEEPQVRVKLITVEGNHRIEPSTILAKTKLKEGDPFSLEVIRDDIENIFQLGYFEDVRVKSKGFEGGLKIIYEVVERPFITEIRFEGFDAVTEEDLRGEITLRKESFLNSLHLKRDIEKLKTFYEGEGYPDAEITPVVRVLGEDRVHLTFYVEEGRKVRVEDILFEGNEAFSERQLRKALVTKEYFWLTSWLTESGRFKKDQLSIDVEALRDYYLNNGYLEIQVGDPKVDLDKENASYTLTFPVIEGQPYTIDEISFEGNEVIGDDALRQVVKSGEGDLFRRNRIRRDIVAITDEFGEIGYAFSDVFPEINPIPETQKVSITFRVREGEPVTVRQINIFGNRKTRDKVIRREIRMDEQELINTKALKRSFQRLNNLNFFETVEILPQEVSHDEMDLNVRVKEKSTGSFSIGGGFSSVDNLVGIFELTQGNLFGRGQLVRAKAEFGGRRNTYSLTFREPYLFDYPVSGTFDLFRLERDFDTYQEKRIGGDLILGRSFTEFVNGSISYTYEKINVFDVLDSSSQRIKDLEGTQSTSAVGLRLTYDSRDNFLDTHEGMRHFLTLELAGTGLGGSNKFFKVTGDSSKFFPLFWDTVFLIHGRVGYGTGLRGRELPLGERFYVGGINTVRGFDFGRAGPIDPASNEVIGGDQELFFNFEYIFPLVREANIKGLLFFDAGRAYDSSLLFNEDISDLRLRYSAGFGFRWISPVGPLRLEWGFNLSPREGEKSRTLEFSIGTLF